MQKKGIDIIGLHNGEPDMEAPDAVRKACLKALEEGKTKYTNVPGIIELREEICNKLRKDNHVSYDPDQICISTGAKQAVNNAVMAVINPGDEVLVPMPGWVSYCEIVKLYGGIPVPVYTDSNYDLDIDAIRQKITPKTAAILINSPNNPTGAVYGREKLLELGKLAVENDFYIISDEIYEKLIYGDIPHTCIASLSPEIYEHSIVINGFSKAFAMTGWRIGYSAAPKDIARGISAIQGHTTSNSTTFVQWAALKALQECEASTQELVDEFKRRRDLVYGRLTAIADIKCSNVEGAFYLLPDVSAYYGRAFKGTVIRDSFDLCNYILKEAKVAIMPGAAYNAPKTVRIAYTNSYDNLSVAMDRLESALKELQ